jgi:hypothetical protein
MYDVRNTPGLFVSNRGFILVDLVVLKIRPGV